MSDPSELRGLRALMYRLEPTPGRQRPHHVRNGVITLALATVFVSLAMIYGYYRDLPWFSGGTTVKAEFASDTNLRVGNPVRVRGVKVGKVTKIEQASDGRAALVTMKLDGKQKISVRRDARAEILWRTLLGRNMYLSLDPGSKSAPPLDGATIPLSRTDSQVEFDQLFQPLKRSGRAAVQTLLREFDDAFRAPGVPGQSLDRLAPTMRSVAPALDALRGQRTGDMSRLVANTHRTMGALARSQERLAGLVDDGAVAFGVTAAHRADLGAFVRDAPATLRETRLTTSRLRTTLDLLDPVADRLRPGLRDLDDASRAVRPALRQATPLLHDARPLAGRLQVALRALTPASRDALKVFEGFDPTLARTVGQILPWLKQRDELGVRNYEAIGPVISTIDSASGQFTTFGHLMRFQGLAGNARSIGLPCATYFNDPKAPQRITCDDFSKVFGALFAGGRTDMTKRKGGR